jgi:toxin secretion/phage lysis holin
MNNYINDMAGNPVIKILVIALMLDIFLGSLRAIKEHSWNSTVGINGMLRKAGMLGSIFLLGMMDSCLAFNLLGFVPEDILAVVKLNKVGICELFGIMFILYEFTSVLKNMVLCDMPCPKWLKKKLEKLLKTMTSELDDKGVDKK